MERKHKRGPGTEPGRVGGNQDFEIRIGLDRGLGARHRSDGGEGEGVI